MAIKIRWTITHPAYQYSKKAVLCQLSAGIPFRVSISRRNVIPGADSPYLPGVGTASFRRLKVLVYYLPKRSTAYTCRFTESSRFTLQYTLNTPTHQQLFYIFKFEQINRSLDLRYHIGVKKRDIRFGFDTIFEHIKFDAKTVGLGIRQICDARIHIVLIVLLHQM